MKSRLAVQYSFPIGVNRDETSVKKARFKGGKEPLKIVHKVLSRPSGERYKINTVILSNYDIDLRHETLKESRINMSC